jgi:hypothetical protein
MQQLPSEILTVWRKFDRFPMETLTKAWFLKNAPETRQRSVQRMREHRAEFGASGNCFDLALWLMDEFKGAGVSSYGVGDGWGTLDAHVAVIALGPDGKRYLCDLGDLWIQPFLIDSEPSVLGQKSSGLFPGAEISARVERGRLETTYHRPGGKQSRQEYDLNPVTEKEFFEFGDFSQQHLSRPLVEMRLFQSNESAHWEFDGEKSFTSSMDGLKEDPSLESPEGWSQRIAAMTGMSSGYALECLQAHEELSGV